MKTYRSTHMIRFEDLNHHENLYAGRGIEWMIEASFIAAALAHGNPHGLLYKNTHQFNFMKSVEPGEIITFESTVVRTGKKSLTMHVHLVDEQSREIKAEGYTTFVIMDEKTNTPMEHGILLDEADTEEEKRWRKEADSFF